MEIVQFFLVAVSFIMISFLIYYEFYYSIPICDRFNDGEVIRFIDDNGHEYIGEILCRDNGYWNAVTLSSCVRDLSIVYDGEITVTAGNRPRTATRFERKEYMDRLWKKRNASFS